MKTSVFLISILLPFTNFSYSQAEETNHQIQEIIENSVKKEDSILQIYPLSPIQGQHLSIDYKLNDYQDVFVEFNNQKYQLFSRKIFIPLSPELKPLEYILTIKKGNEKLSEIKFKIKSAKFGKQNISFYKPKLSIKAEEKIAQEDNLVEIAKNSYSSERLWDKPFILPVPHRVSDVYGTKRYLNRKYNGYHSGVDFASPYGYPIKAINNAKVSLAQYFSKYNSNGNIVYLDHGLGVGSVYLHLSKINVKEGQMVKRGETIGFIGSSGRSTGPHLHWGVYLFGKNTDGLAWVRNSSEYFK